MWGNLQKEGGQNKLKKGKGYGEDEENNPRENVGKTTEISIRGGEKRRTRRVREKAQRRLK